MKKLIVVLLLLIVTVGAAVWFYLRRPAPRAAELLPDTTLLFLRIPDFARARHEFRQTGAYRLWEEPAVRAFLEKPLAALDAAVGAPHVTNNQRARDLILDTLQGEVFLAVTRFSPLMPSQPGLVFGTDTKQNLLQTKLVVGTFERNIRKQQPAGALVTKKYLGHEYTAWRRDETNTICYGFLKSLFLITLQEDVYRDLIARHAQAKPASTLAGHAAFQSFLNQMQSGDQFAAFLNFQPITALLAPLLAFQNQGTSALQKLAAIQSTGLILNFAGSQIHERRITRYAPGAHTPTAPIARRTLAFTQPDTLAYLASATDLASFYTETATALVQAGLPKPAAVINNLERDLRRANIRLTDDVLAKLGPETAWIVNWRPTARAPEVAYIATVRDPDRGAFDKVLDVLATHLLAAAELDAPWNVTEHRGHSLRSLVIGAATIAPTYVLTDEFFILALTPDFARALLDQLANPKPTLTGSPDFQKATAHLPGTVTDFSYVDLRALYPHLTGLTRELPPNEFLDLSQLPDEAVVTKHLAPFVAATTGTAEATVTHSSSPIGSPLGLVAGVAAGFLINRAAILPNGAMPFLDTDARRAPRGNPPAASPTPPTVFAAPPLQLSLEAPAETPPP